MRLYTDGFDSLHGDPGVPFSQVKHRHDRGVCTSAAGKSLDTMLFAGYGRPGRPLLDQTTQIEILDSVKGLEETLLVLQCELNGFELVLGQ